MRITDLLKKEGIRIGASPADKPAAIEELIALHEACGNLLDTAAYREGILKREAMGTTAIGMEIAIPHAKSEAVKAPTLTAMTVAATAIPVKSRTSAGAGCPVASGLTILVSR